MLVLVLKLLKVLELKISTLTNEGCSSDSDSDIIKKGTATESQD